MKLARRIISRFFRKTILFFTPRRVRLPLRYRLHLRGRQCEPELRHLARIAGKGKVAVDVGANVGFYAYAMADLFGKVYAFEVNPQLTHELQSAGKQNIEVINKGLSSKERTATLYIPVADGLPQPGWASLMPGNHPYAEHYIEKQVEVCTLDQFELDNVGLIKIDVEGHELEVLRGALKTIDRCHPILIIEVAESNATAVELILGQLGYETRSLDDLAGVYGSVQNMIFVPGKKPPVKEHKPEVEEDTGLFGMILRENRMIREAR